MVRRRETRRPLSGAPVDSAVVERAYQVRAVKAVDAAFDEKQRDALLVMATGSGKTRTVIALADQLMKAGWVKRVLFLADRTALVRQAVNAFKMHLPAVTTVNLVEKKYDEGRVYAATYPTMLNLINETDGAGLRRFGPGHFDLVVIDEAHRSVYQRYGAIFDWFDSLLVGLTATPKDEVDHNTYRLFHLEDRVPTDAYTLEEAVDQGYLVPAHGVSVGTTFLRHGIRYDDLTEEEKDQWDSLDWGDEDVPDEVGAEEINRFLFNEDTVDKVLATLLGSGHKVAGGDRLGKTIVFAKSQAHAEFVQRRFDVQWPHLAGEFARVITHGTPYADRLIEDFKVADKAPHIAISVDMLDTGIDVPEVVNLVFFKMIRSKSKFWQMIGRGTRLCPDLFGPGKAKQDFYGEPGVLQPEPARSRGLGAEVARPAAVRNPAGPGPGARRHPYRRRAARERRAGILHEFVAGMTLDNVLVRLHRRAVERYADRSVWSSLSNEEYEELLRLAGLPSSAQDDDEEAKRFDLLMLRRQLAQLDGDAVTAEQVREVVQAIAAALLGKQAIPSVAQQLELLDAIAGDEWWVDVTLPLVELARLRIRGLVRFVEKTRRSSACAATNSSPTTI
ncbi:MAG: DEAD/DEAH box helicase family protein [Pseudonocardia sp.]|nr:DEAD/DEAH box helicase family protein [Pseudonocardia sp.]